VIPPTKASFIRSHMIYCDLNFCFRDVTAGCFREAALDSMSEIGRPNVNRVSCYAGSYENG
jgi:hypothetical protein